MGLLSLPEMTKIVDATAGPVTTNGGVTADYVSIKNCARLYIVVNLTQAVGHATLLTPRRATAVDGSGVVVLGTNIRIWANEDTAASDTLVSQTAALNFTVANDIKKKMVVFEIDVMALGFTSASPGVGLALMTRCRGSVAYDVVNLLVADSSQATNFISANYFLTDLRFQQATPPAAITD